MEVFASEGYLLPVVKGSGAALVHLFVILCEELGEFGVLPELYLVVEAHFPAGVVIPHHTGCDGVGHLEGVLQLDCVAGGLRAAVVGLLIHELGCGIDLVPKRVCRTEAKQVLGRDLAEVLKSEIDVIGGDVGFIDTACLPDIIIAESRLYGVIVVAPHQPGIYTKREVAHHLPSRAEEHLVQAAVAVVGSGDGLLTAAVNVGQGVLGAEAVAYGGQRHEAERHADIPPCAKLRSDIVYRRIACIGLEAALLEVAVLERHAYIKEHRERVDIRIGRRILKIDYRRVAKALRYAGHTFVEALRTVVHDAEPIAGVGRVGAVLRIGADGGRHEGKHHDAAYD